MSRVALELNAPPVALLAKLPPKNIKSATNGDDDDHNNRIPDLFDGSTTPADVV